MPIIATPLTETVPDVPGVVATVQATAPEICCDPLPPSNTLLSAVSCLGQDTVSAETTTRYRKSLYRRQKSVTVRGGSAATLEWRLVDWQGSPLDLSECVCDVAESVSSESVSSVAGECDFVLRFRLREQLLGRCSREFAVTVVDPATGIVHVALDSETTKKPGVYYGEIAAFQNTADADAGENLAFSNIFTVIITGGQWVDTRKPGPPSFAEIRLHLRDSDPRENLLLDGLSFDDAEIAFAIRRPVEYWNEIPPPLRTYSTQTFPFRYHWLMGITGELFLIAAEGYRKNHLAYSAAGISIDDQAKEPNYEKAAQMRLQDFRDFVRRKKVEMNVAGGFSEVTSDYGRGF